MKLCLKDTLGGSEVCDPSSVYPSEYFLQILRAPPAPLLPRTSPTHPVHTRPALPRPMMYACIRACLRRRQKGSEG